MAMWRFWLSLLTLPCILHFVVANFPPRFIVNGSSEIRLELLEGPDTPPGKLLYHLQGEDPDGDELTFNLQGQLANDLLRIERFSDTEAGLYLKQQLDREAQSVYQLILTLTDGANTISQSLQIEVQDVNDNAPVFTKYPSTIFIKEGTSANRKIAEFEAVDADEGLYGEVIYKLQFTDNDSGKFSVNTIARKGILNLDTSLDYEEKNLYQLQLLAIDRAPSGVRNTATAAILVKVEDFEDQPPEFIRVPSVTKIPENLPTGSTVLEVRAVDGDRGINNRIYYSILEVSGDGDSLFGIEPTSGRVYVQKALDRESGDTNGAYILKIQAQEEGSSIIPPPKTITEVTVILTDVNDEIPRFRSTTYVGEISENAQINVPVTFLGNTKAEVYDHDQGRNGTFKLFLENDNGTFEVSPDEGINEASFLIRVKNYTLLDYETNKVLTCKVIAVENVDSNARSSTADFTIYVRDSNDNLPEFASPTGMYIAHVPENVQEGTPVVRIKATDADSGSYGTEGIRYTDIAGHISNKLALDPITGVVSIKSSGTEFDREQVSSYYLTIEARDDLGRGNRNTIQLRLDIDDINDNAPRFLQDRYEIRVSENELNFSKPFFVEAHDRDLEGTPNQQIEYSIVDGDPLGNFTVNATSGEIRMQTSLDFESFKSRTNSSGRAFNVTVKAQDRGAPPLHSHAQVIIHVMDVNDHSPVFEKTQYSRSIREDAGPGTPVLQVSASDSDGSSPNNNIVFMIQSGAHGKFTIHPETGMISVAPGANLDPDQSLPKILVYTLNVVAIDGGVGDHQRQNSTVVNLTILDINNKPPNLVLPGEVYIAENMPMGTVVSKVSALDFDDNPDLRFSLKSEDCEALNENGVILPTTAKNFSRLFEVSPSTGIIRLLEEIDREVIATVKLSLMVEDINSANGAQKDSDLLVIHITDVNDNVPVFRKQYFKETVAENSKIGIAIMTVVATDADKNRTISYKLQGDADILQLVGINQHSGEISVLGKIDRELFAWLNFSVQAKDNGFPAKTSIARVTIQILDENDNNPVFRADNYHFSVQENVAVGYELGKVEALDADIGDYGKVTYFLDKRASYGKFAINRDTGVITIAEELDRETRDKYMLVVEAWDNYAVGFTTGDSRKTFQQVSVTILDNNDNRPELQIPSGCTSVSEYHKVGEAVLSLKATDKDDPASANGIVTFSIEGGNEDGLFSIKKVDSTTCRIVTEKSLKQKMGNHTLTVAVIDEGHPHLKTSSEVGICVYDVNDNAPRFVSPSRDYTIPIKEDVAVSSSVVQVEAVDDDVGVNGEVRYRILEDFRGDAKTFAVDEETGIITLQQALDREVKKTYQIRVEAFDLGLPTPLASDMDIHFYVQNVNDVEPQFNVPEQVIQFSENTQPGVEVRTIVETFDNEAYDVNEKSATVCYFIIAGNDKNIFVLDRVTREMSIATVLDREQQNSHVLRIKATKDCNNFPPTKNLSFVQMDKSVITITVEINDINDNSPVFNKKLFTGGLSFNQDVGTPIMRIQAIDKDVGRNAQLTYILIGKVTHNLQQEIVDPPFTINSTSGDILLNFSPQKSSSGHCKFSALVQDPDGRNDTADVKIYIVREDQKYSFTLRLTPDEFKSKVDVFESILSQVTGVLTNVDSFKYHVNKAGSVDKTRTDVVLHFVNKNDDSVLESKDIAQLLDDKMERLNLLFREFNVLEGKPVLPLYLAQTAEEVIIAVLIGTTVCLAIMLIAVTSLCLAQKRRYERQLKAATATAFGSRESGLNRITVPNTNQHCIEGSNPIWMHSYENEWYKEEDVISHSSGDSGNSLDENALNHVVGEASSSGSTATQVGVVDEVTPSEKDQNDLNNFHKHNIYEALGLNNVSIMAHLETTEL